MIFGFGLTITIRCLRLLMLPMTLLEMFLLCYCISFTICCAIFHGQNRGVQVFIPSPFVAHVDDDECTACGNCSDRCPVGAIEVNDVAVVDAGKCLGCGVCVPSCSSESLRLVRRPQPA